MAVVSQIPLPYSTPFPIPQSHQVEAVALLKLHILEAVFAEPELGLFPIVFREWGEVPGIDLIVPNVDFVYIFHLGDLGDKVGKEGKESSVEQGIRKQGSTGKTPPLLTASCSFSKAAVVGSISA